jgi:opacity protein-like surface antigen
LPKVLKKTIMKIRKPHIKYIQLTVLLMLFIYNFSFSQGSDKSESKHQKLYFGIESGPSKNKIFNERAPSFPTFTSTNENSFSGSFGLGYYFSKSFGISTGLGYDTYTTGLYVDTYSSKYSATDSEKEIYEKRVTGTGIKELQKISFLSIPVLFNIQIGSRFGFFLHAGITYSLPLGNEFNSSGTFSFTGYYPAYNVLFQNLPEYGFPEDAKISSTGTLDLKSNIINGIGNAGFQLFISEKFQIALGVEYKRSLSDIAEYNTPDKFQLSTDPNNINSIMGGSSQSILESMGLRFSLRYYLR